MMLFYGSIQSIYSILKNLTYKALSGVPKAFRIKLVRLSRITVNLSIFMGIVKEGLLLKGFGKGIFKLVFEAGP